MSAALGYGAFELDMTRTGARPVLFASGWFSGRLNLLLSGFFLLFQASLLSCLLVLGLVLPAVVLDYAVIFLHGKTTQARSGRSCAFIPISGEYRETLSVP
jgi:hypothetical protein